MAATATADKSPLESRAFNIALMDVDRFIATHRLGKVTSPLIFEPSTRTFDPHGLFSEEIFEPIASNARLLTFGYIDLNTMIIHPIVYQALVKISALYDDVMAGRAYAAVNPVTNMLERVNGDPVDTPGAGTGYQFFINILPSLKHPTSDSDARKNRLAILERYSDRLLIKRHLVLPAGLRDVTTEDARITQDDVNGLYRRLLSLTKALPPGSTSELYDQVRLSIQRTTQEILHFFINVMDGKRGFMQGVYASRRIAHGTRNVLTATDFTSIDLNDPQMHRHNETKVGLYQTMGGLLPIVTYWMRTAFIKPILGSGDTPHVALTNTKTLELEYVTIKHSELIRFTGPDAIRKAAMKFENVDVREKPITIATSTGWSYLALVYDTGDKVSLARSINDLKANLGDDFKRDYVRPLTWVDAFYMATFNAAKGRHAYITRYPVIEDGSTYPSKIHLCTTNPGRVVQMHDLLSGELTLQYPQYPIFGKPYNDTVSVFTARLGGLGGDYDGDTVSMDFVWSDEANAQIVEHMSSIRFHINSQLKLLSANTTDLIGYFLRNMTYDAFKKPVR